VEPTSNCSSASGASLFAGAAAVMQAVETETVILYHTDLRGEWPEEAARALAARLRYAKRLALEAPTPAARASLAGVALALRALERACGRAVPPGELVFESQLKPRWAGSPHGVDFSITHSGPWVGAAALCGGRVGLDLECGTDARTSEWVAREAVLKAAGLGVRALREVELTHDGARCRGAHWHTRALAHFPGAMACVASELVPRALQTHAVPLAELFA